MVLKKPKAYVSHQLPHRARIQVPSKRGVVPFFERTRKRLKKFPEIHQVDVNPVSGSFLLIFEGSLEEVCRKSLNDIIEIKSLPKNHSGSESQPWIYLTSRGMKRLNQRLIRASGRRLDLPTLSITGLLGLSALQLYRGQVLPPAWTLLRDVFFILFESGLTKKDL
jgi:hypothetical protein